MANSAAYVMKRPAEWAAQLRTQGWQLAAAMQKAGWTAATLVSESQYTEAVNAAMDHVPAPPPGLKPESEE
jgi:hypothetical protein